jgi:hypothetical protein
MLSPEGERDWPGAWGLTPRPSGGGLRLGTDEPAKQSHGSRRPDRDRPGAASGKTAQLPLAEAPSPSCVALLDQLDGAARHVRERLNFAVVAQAPFSRVATFGAERGWRHLRLLSSAKNSYKRDYSGLTEDGSPMPTLNALHRDAEVIRHVWAPSSPRAKRSRPGPPERRHARAAPEPVRRDAGRAADGLGRAAGLPVGWLLAGWLRPTRAASGRRSSWWPAARACRGRHAVRLPARRPAPRRTGRARADAPVARSGARSVRSAR